MKINQLKFTGHPTHRIPNHISFIVVDSYGNPLPSRKVLRELTKRFICASSGTACSSGQLKDSNVLTSIGISKELRQSGIRFSLSSDFKDSDIDVVTRLLLESISI